MCSMKMKGKRHLIREELFYMTVEILLLGLTMAIFASGGSRTFRRETSFDWPVY